MQVACVSFAAHIANFEVTQWHICNDNNEFIPFQGNQSGEKK